MRESHSSHSKSSGGGGGGEEDAEENVAMDLKHFGGDLRMREEKVYHEIWIFFLRQAGVMLCLSVRHGPCDTIKFVAKVVYLAILLTLK